MLHILFVINYIKLNGRKDYTIKSVEIGRSYFKGYQKENTTPLLKKFLNL